MLNISDIELTKLCRTCLSIGEMKSLFEKSATEPDLAKMLMTCTPVEYYGNNGLPEQVCQDCFNEISRSYKFAIQCRQTEDKLQVYLQNLVKLKTSLICDSSIFKTIKPNLKNKSENAPVSSSKTDIINQGAALNLPKFNIENVHSLSNTLSTSELHGDLHQQLDICKHEIDYDNNFEENRNIENVYLPSVTTSTDQNDVLLTDVRSEIGSNLAQDVSWLKTEIIDDDLLRNEIKIEIKIEHDDSDAASTIDPLDFCDSPELDQNNDIKTEQVFEEIRDDTIFVSTYTPTQPLIPFTHSNPVVVLERLHENGLLASAQCDDLPEETEMNTSGSSVVTRHIAERVNQREYPCPICERSYFRPYELNRHIKVHKRDMYSCKICKRQFNIMFNLLRHMRSHRQVCPICHKTYHDYYDLQRHKLTHSKPVNVSCKYCNKTYKSSRTLESHVQVEHNEKDNKMVQISCKFCNKKFARAHVLEQHISLMHNDTESNFSESTFEDILASKRLRNSDKKYQCKICKKYFSKYYINNHMLKHANDKVLHCPICKETFTKHYQLRRHYSSHRTNEKISVVNCEFCLQKFSSELTLRRHIQTICRKHLEPNSELSKTGRNEYSCKVCNLYYYKIKDLNEHMLQHTDKESICMICEKDFFQRVQLMSHMAMHISNKSLSCTICKKNCETKHNLKTHEDSCIANSLSCEVCSKVFPHKRSLQRHQHRVHGYRNNKRPNDDNQKPRTDNARKSEDHTPNVNDQQNAESNADEAYKLRKRSAVKTSYVDDDANYTDYDSDSTINKPHTNNEIAPLKIENGDKPSTSKSLMPHRCVICKRTYKLKKSLRTHMKFAHFGKKHTCLMCQMVFKSQHYLRRHKHQHHSNNQLTNTINHTNNELDQSEESKTTSIEYAQSELPKPKALENIQLNNENSQNILSNDNTDTTNNSQCEPTESKNIQNHRFDNKNTHSQHINNDSKWRHELEITEAFISVLSEPNLIVQSDSNNIENYQSVNKYSPDKIPNSTDNYQNNQNHRSDTENCRYKIPINNTNYLQAQSSTDYKSELSKLIDFEYQRTESSTKCFQSELLKPQNYRSDNENYRNKITSIDSEYRKAQCSTEDCQNELLKPQNYQSDYENCANELSNTEYENVRNTVGELSMAGEYQNHRSENEDKQYELLKPMDYQNHRLDPEDCHSEISNDQTEISDDQSDRCTEDDQSEHGDNEDGQSEIINVKSTGDCDVSEVKDYQNLGVDNYNEPPSNENYKKYGLRKRASQKQSYTEVSDEEFEDLRDSKRRKLNNEVVPNNSSCKLYSCSNCHKRFTNEDVVRQHVNSYHTKIKSTGVRYSCEMCEHPFREVADLEAHKSVHQGPQPYTCTFCDMRCVSLPVLKLHMHLHDDDRRYACKFCKRRYKGKQHLSRHEKRHNPSFNSYKCEVCDKHVAKRNWRKHMNSHKSKQSISCSICEIQLASMYSLKNHMKIHNGGMHICGICKNEYTSRSSLYVHMLSHSGLNFECSICLKTFKSAPYLRLHQKSHATKIFQCTLCDKAFKIEQGLLTHMRKMHS